MLLHGASVIMRKERDPEWAESITWRELEPAAKATNTSCRHGLSQNARKILGNNVSTKDGPSPGLPAGFPMKPDRSGENLCGGEGPNPCCSEWKPGWELFHLNSRNVWYPEFKLMFLYQILSCILICIKCLFHAIKCKVLFVCFLIQSLTFEVYLR